MRKILAITIMLVLFMSIFQVAYAADPNIEVDLKGTTEITQDAETVTLIIALGAFTEIPENPTIAYQAVLEYDETIFSSVSVEGINNWSANYEEPNILGETITTGAANTEIARITFTLNENVEPGTTTVKLTGGQISAGSTSDLEFDFDSTFEKEVNITITENTEEEENQDQNNTTNENATENTVENTTESENNTTNNTNNTNSTNNTTGATVNNTDNTTASNKLPSTGIEKIALIAVLVLIAGIGCLIRYKSIKIK